MCEAAGSRFCRQQKAIKLTPENEPNIEYVVEGLITPKGAANRIVLNQLDTESTKGIKVVEEFPNVFPEELSGMLCMRYPQQRVSRLSRN